MYCVLLYRRHLQLFYLLWRTLSLTNDSTSVGIFNPSYNTKGVGLLLSVLKIEKNTTYHTLSLVQNISLNLLL